MIQNLNKILRARMPELLDGAIEEKVETNDDENMIKILQFIEKSHNEIANGMKVLADNQRMLLNIMTRIEEKISKNE